MIRAQYHFRSSSEGLLAWDVRRLVKLSSKLEVLSIPVSQIGELDENYWYAYDGQVPTCRSLTEHFSLINQADLSYPIILDAEGRVMDGMHRVCKAVLIGDASIRAVRFIETPPPDYIGRAPNELPYD